MPINTTDEMTTNPMSEAVQRDDFVFRGVGLLFIGATLQSGHRTKPSAVGTR